MATHTCSKCGHTFSVPDWLDTDIKCPKCAGKAQKDDCGDRPSSPQRVETSRGVEASEDAASTDRVTSPQPATAQSPQPAATPSPANATIGRAFAKWSNDSRLRSLLAGAIGGFLGGMAAELLVGGPTKFVDTVFVGLFVGVGIAALLGIAEGISIGSWTLARRGLVIGSCLGAFGGAAGATCGQLTYKITSPAAESADDSGSGSFIHPTRPKFSPEVAKRIEQEEGETGEIEIALIWHNRNDLDLHVVDPNGEEIYYGNKRSASGGWLDIDKNAGCGSTTDSPIEHVRWKIEDVPWGSFTVYVKHYSNCGPADPTSYHCEIKNGDSINPFDGTISYGDSKKLIHTFTRTKVPEAPPAQPTKTEGLGLIQLAGIVVGWLVFGVLVGCAKGFTRKSILALRNAAMGGAIGGLLGGLIVAIITVASVSSSLVGLHDGWQGRLVGFTVLGSCIGLWIVIIERALSAILSVVNGQYEGREIFLDKEEMRIGRSDALDIYLGGDPQISDHHATIRREGDSHSITGEGGDVQVGNSTVSRRQLQNGDTITLGKTQLVYKHKTISQSAGEVDRAAANR